MKDPGEHAGRRTAQGDGIDSGPLQRLPRHLEQQALLGVHRQRLAGRDPEEGGVEIPDVLEEPAAARVGLSDRVRIRIEEPGQAPAAVRRELRDDVAALNHHLPQRLWRVHPTGIAASHAHRRHRFGGGGEVLAVLALEPLVFLQRLAKGPDEALRCCRSSNAAFRVTHSAGSSKGPSVDPPSQPPRRPKRAPQGRNGGTRATISANATTPIRNRIPAPSRASGRDFRSAAAWRGCRAARATPTPTKDCRSRRANAR